jgi:proteic killer suppression protein
MLDVRFRDAELRGCYEKEARGRTRWGAKVARSYIRRINQLFACASEQDLRNLPPLRFHALTGQRKGEYAIDIDGFWRIILTFEDRAHQILIIEEVSKHYDD